MNDALHPSARFRNQLLAALAPDDLAILAPHLEAVTLERRKPLEHPNKPIEHLYFMEHGIASVVTANDPNAQIEIGLIGRKGVSGLAVVLGGDRSPHSTYMQVGGDGLRIGVRPFRDAFEQSAGLRSIPFRYAHVFLVQTAATAAANAKGSIEERLARWLLMAHDRVDSVELPLTHEFLALMLGTRRPGVTEAVHALTKGGLIRADRGILVVVDREGLVERAGKLYGEPESEYDRLFDSQNLNNAACLQSAENK